MIKNAMPAKISMTSFRFMGGRGPLRGKNAGAANTAAASMPTSVVCHVQESGIPFVIEDTLPTLPRALGSARGDAPQATAARLPPQRRIMLEPKSHQWLWTASAMLAELFMASEQIRRPSMRYIKSAVTLLVVTMCCLAQNATGYVVGNGSTCYYHHSVSCCSTIVGVWPEPICCDAQCLTVCDYSIIVNSPSHTVDTTPDGRGSKEWNCSVGGSSCTIVPALYCDDEEPDGCKYDTTPIVMGTCDFCIPTPGQACP